MNAIYEQVYKNYYKANKVYKQQILKKYGFTNEADFFKFIGKEAPAPKAVKPKPTVSPFKKVVAVEDGEATDYVIAFDTTGSMSSYINSVKKHVKELIPTLFKDTPNLQLKVVAFGDYCDMTSVKNNEFGKAFQESALTNDENALIDFVTKAQNTSGGDSDEFYELVIQKITNETPWREGSKRNVLLIADYTPHAVGYVYGGKAHNIDWRKEAANSAAKGIQWDTLKIIPRHNWYDELSKTTGGVCMDFKNSNKISQVIEAASAVRYNKEKFRSMYASATLSNDVELMGAYKSLSTL